MDKENTVNSFTFYLDYYNLIDTMPLKDKKELAVAILDYVFKDEIPNLKGHNQAIFNTLSKQLDCSKNKSKSAKKTNQKEIKSKSNENQIEIKKGNKTSILSFKFYISSFIVSNFKFLDNNNKQKIENKIIDWVKYKQEKNKPYKEQGLKSLLTQIENKTREYGVEKIINLIDECMANNYQGIIFDKLKQETQKETASEKMKRLEKEAEEYDKLEAMKNDQK